MRNEAIGRPPDHHLVVSYFRHGRGLFLGRVGAEGMLLMDTAIRKEGSPCLFPRISPSHVGMVTDSETATPVHLRISC